MINNEEIIDKDKKLLEFFVSHIDDQREKIVQQINFSHVTKDSSPYYLILEFHVNPLSVTPITGYPFDSYIQVLHAPKAPTVILFIKNGLVYQFEVFNADSGYMDYDALCEGEVIVELK